MMKKLAIALCFSMAFVVPAFGQTVDPCSQSTKLSGGTKYTITTQEQQTGTVGSDYEYELWHNIGESKNAVSITVYGANQGGGAAFRGDWNEPNTKFDYLARIGYKFEKNGNGSGKLFTEYDDIFADYNYTRSDRLNGQNYSYIGIYGWARAGTNSKLVEFYIVDDWWGNQYQGDNTPVTTSTTGGSEVATATIDGASYKIIKNSRQGQPSIEGNKDFDQYFSVRQTPRKCGTISITEHFKAWDKAGLKLGKLYEAKILAEVGAYGASTTTGWIDYSYAKMRMGSGTTPSSSSVAASSSSSKPSSSSVAASSSSKPSSSSAAASSSSKASSSSAAASSSSHASSSSTIASSSSGVSQSSSSVSQSSSSGATEGSSSSGEEETPILKNRIPATHFSIQMQSDKTLRIEANSPTVVEIFDLRGNKVASLNVSGSQTVKLSLPSGIYFAKVHGIKSVRFVLR